MCKRDNYDWVWQLTSEKRGRFHDAPFIFNPNDSGYTYFFAPQGLKEFITFDWLKKHIICEEHNWVYHVYPPIPPNVDL